MIRTILRACLRARGFAAQPSPGASDQSLLDRLAPRSPRERAADDWELEHLDGRPSGCRLGSITVETCGVAGIVPRGSTPSYPRPSNEHGPGDERGG